MPVIPAFKYGLCRYLDIKVVHECGYSAALMTVTSVLVEINATKQLGSLA